MSNKILEVSADANRQMSQTIEGSFYSTHKQEDIEKWLSHKNADTDDNCFEEVFGGDWYDEDCWDGLEEFNLEIKESEDADEGYCEFDDEIQEFIDEEPKRERDAGIRTVTYQLKDMIGNFDGIKDTTIQLFNDFKEVVKTDDVEKMTEDEKKLYQTLNDMTQLSLKFPKPEVKKETYEPF